MVIKPSWCLQNAGTITTDLKRCGDSVWALGSIHLDLPPPQPLPKVNFMGQSYLTNSLLPAKRFDSNIYQVPVMC